MEEQIEIMRCYYEQLVDDYWLRYSYLKNKHKLKEETKKLLLESYFNGYNQGLTKAQDIMAKTIRKED